MESYAACALPEGLKRERGKNLQQIEDKDNTFGSIVTFLLAKEDPVCLN